MSALRHHREPKAILVGIAAIALAAGVFAQPAAGAEPEDEPAQAAGTTLTSSVSADSGVAVQTLCTNCNNADLSISGMGNEHVSVVCDGVPVPTGLAQIYLFSVMPPTRIDKIDVNKGAGDPAYVGAAVGGGIEIERTEPQRGLKLNASADQGSYGWKGGRLDLSGQWDWIGGYAVGSLSESDRIDSNRDSWADLPESDRYTLEAGLDMRPAESHRVRIGGSRYSEDQLDGPAAAYSYNQRTCVGLDQVLFETEPCSESPVVGYNREDVQMDRDQSEVIYDLSVGSGTKLSFAGALARRSQEIQETTSRTDSTIRLLSEDELQFIEDNYGLTAEELAELGFPIGIPSAARETLPSYSIDDENRHASAVLTQSIGHGATLRAGASVTGNSFQVIDVGLNTFRNKDPETDYPLDQRLEENVSETGFWVEGDVALGSRLSLAAGVRYVEYRYTDNEEEINARLNGIRDAWLEIPLPEGDRLLPRAALTWKALDELTLRLSAGAGLRAPAPAFDKVCCGRQYRGNRGVALEESRSAGLEVTYQPGPRWRVGGSVFLTEFDDLIVNMATQSDQWKHVYQNVNIVEARNTSFNVEGRFEPRSWVTTSVSYSWLDMENEAPEGAITTLVDPGGSTPQERTFFYDEVPYATDGHGAVGVVFKVPLEVTLTLAATYTGTTRIQRFNDQNVNFGVDPELVETEAFWVANLRVNKAFRNGLAFYYGVDNAFDYVQGNGCSGSDASADPQETGCLGDPRYDYNWGPLRGRYYYAGLGYAFGK